MSRTVEDKSMLHDARSTENSRLLELPDEQLLKEDAIARLLTTSLSKLRRLRAIGQGPPSVKIGKSVRYRVGDLRRWLDLLGEKGDSPLEGDVIPHKLRATSRPISLDDRPLTSSRPMRPLLLSKRQTASLLNVCGRTVDVLISRGQLKVHRVGTRVLVVTESVERYVRG